MLYLLAIVLPPVALVMAGKPFQGTLSLVLMLTVIGWIPAAIWAVLVVKKRDDDRRAERVVEAIRQQRQG